MVLAGSRAGLFFGSRSANLRKFAEIISIILRKCLNLRPLLKLSRLNFQTKD